MDSNLLEFTLARKNPYQIIAGSEEVEGRKKTFACSLVKHQHQLCAKFALVSGGWKEDKCVYIENASLQHGSCFSSFRLPWLRCTSQVMQVLRLSSTRAQLLQQHPPQTVQRVVSLTPTLRCVRNCYFLVFLKLSSFLSLTPSRLGRNSLLFTIECSPL